MILNLRRQNGIPGHNRHAALPKETAITLRISGSAKLVVTVQIQVCLQSGVRGSGKEIGIELALRLQCNCKGLKCGVFKIKVETLQGDHIRTGLADFGDHRIDLWIICARDTPEQEAGTFAGQFSVEGCNAKRLSGADRPDQKTDAKGDQAVCILPSASASAFA